MDQLLDISQTVLVAYLAWKEWRAKPHEAPELIDLVRQALMKRTADGRPMTGRERLQARLAARVARETQQ
jgi:hypothetical protein